MENENKVEEVISIYEVINPVLDPSTTKGRIFLDVGEKVIVGTDLMCGLYYENLDDGRVGHFLATLMMKGFIPSHFKKLKDLGLPPQKFYMLCNLAQPDYLRIPDFVKFIDSYIKKEE